MLDDRNKPSFLTAEPGELRVPPIFSNVITDFRALEGRIGIIGGTFDPPQLGHLHAARVVKRALFLDAVVFVPSHQNPLKAWSPEASDAERMMMVSSTIADDEGLFVSPIELQKDGPSYTVDTLSEIEAQVKEGVALYFIVGSDCLTRMREWKDLEGVFEKAHLVVVGRGEAVEDAYRHFLEGLPAGLRAKLRSTLIDAPQVPASSSEIRKACAQGEILSDSLHPFVAQYLETSKLYQDNPEDAPRRFSSNGIVETERKGVSL